MERMRNGGPGSDRGSVGPIGSVQPRLNLSITAGPDRIGAASDRAFTPRERERECVYNRRTDGAERERKREGGRKGEER
jgi:hypothetical protein